MLKHICIILTLLACSLQARNLPNTGSGNRVEGGSSYFTDYEQGNSLLFLDNKRFFLFVVVENPIRTSYTLGYVDGMSLYGAYFASGFALDPMGTETGTERGTKGKIKWSIASTKGGLGATTRFEFHPYDGCCCEQISFIQRVKSTVDGKIWHAGDYDYSNQFVDETGYKIDHVESETDPYYGAKWSKKEKKWITEGIRLRRGGGTKIGSCQPKRMAWMEDTPQFGDLDDYQKSKKYEMNFETCAICIDTGEILGCITWGFTVINLKITTYGGGETGYSREPSSDFKKAVNKWNDVSKKDKDFHSVTPVISIRKNNFEDANAFKRL